MPGAGVTSVGLAVLAAVSYLAVVVVWTLVTERRLERLLREIRAQEPALWQVLGEPRGLRDIGNWRTRRVFRLLKADPVFAATFDPVVVTRIRVEQRWVTRGLIALALAGGAVLYAVSPYLR